MKLGIGTVQFGVEYGVSNKLGITDKNEVESILKFGSESGIKFIDTSPAYGDSQKKLGSALSTKHFNLVTKLNKIDEDFTPEVVKKLIEGIYQSLTDLQAEQIYGVLIHKPSDVKRKGFSLLFESLKDLKKKGVVKKIGISVYDKSQIEDYLKFGIPDIIQIPLNLLDQRLVNDSLIADLRAKGTEIHVRSVFLQGLLLMDEKDIPAFFDPIKPLLKQYFEALSAAGVSKLSGALSFAKNLDMVDVLLVGVSTKVQLAEIVEAYKATVELDFSRFKVNDSLFLNPSNWMIK